MRRTRGMSLKNSLLKFAIAAVIISSLLLSVLPVWSGPAAVNAQTEELWDYHTYNETKELLYSLENDYPDIAKVYDIGDSWEKSQGIADRDILALKLSDNPDKTEDEPKALYMGLHHAREWPTVEVLVHFISHMTENYGSDERVTRLIDERELWIVPIVNPDGLEYAQTTDALWRKNRRDNGDGTSGVDLNRNYGYEWGVDPSSSDNSSSENYIGPYPFSEPETRAVRNLASNISFDVSVSYHTFGGVIMYPWGYTYKEPEDRETLEGLAKDISSFNGYKVMQASSFYPTRGDSEDWLYGNTSCLSFIIELGKKKGSDYNESFHPSYFEEVDRIVEDNLGVNLYLAEIAAFPEPVPPSITHVPVEEAVVNQTMSVSAAVSDLGGVDTVLLHYKEVGAASFKTVYMNLTSGDSYNGTWEAAIPPQAEEGNLSYFIEARDTTRASRWPEDGYWYVDIKPDDGADDKRFLPAVDIWLLVSLLALTAVAVRVRNREGKT